MEPDDLCRLIVSWLDILRSVAWIALISTLLLGALTVLIYYVAMSIGV